MNIEKINQFIVKNNRRKLTIELENRPDKGYLYIDRALTDFKLNRVREILRFNDNWDLVVYIILDYITDFKIKYI